MKEIQKSLSNYLLFFSGSNEYPTYLKQYIWKEKATNCNNFEYQIINNTNHFYNNKEEEISKIPLNDESPYFEKLLARIRNTRSSEKIF